jgi:hypothetical protein
MFRLAAEGMALEDSVIYTRARAGFNPCRAGGSLIIDHRPTVVCAPAFLRDPPETLRFSRAPENFWTQITENVPSEP